MKRNITFENTFAPRLPPKSYHLFERDLTCLVSFLVVKKALELGSPISVDFAPPAYTSRELPVLEYQSFEIPFSVPLDAI